MRRLVLLEHMSLDGYLAGPGGDMHWIRVDDELWDYVTPIIDAADTAIYGRITYQMMQAYWPTAADATVISQLRRQSGKDLVLLGSASLARTLIRDGVVDEYRINVNPVVVGGGTPLFPDATSVRQLSLESSRIFQSGVVGLHYTAAAPS